MALPAHLAVDVLFSEIATGNIAKIRLYYAVESGTDPNVTNIQGYANDFKTAFNTALPPCLPSTHHFFAVNCRWLGVEADVEARSSVAPSPGTAGSQVLAEEAAVCIQRRTGVKGRMNRGRVFMPFVPANFAVGSTLTVPAMTAYLAVGVMIRNSVTADDAGSGDEAVFVPRQPNFKNGTLRPVIQTRVLSELVSRRDRRHVKRGEPVTNA